MKVLHLIAYNSGGAARAARRINDALKSVGVDSSILFTDGSVPEECIVRNTKDLILHKVHRRLNERLVRECPRPWLFSADRYGFDISKMREVREADIIHLHWISEGMISLKGLEKLAKLGKPVVWTLHDMRVFTGGCHYSEECRRYEDTCGACPVLESDADPDLSTDIQNRTYDAIKDMDLDVVGCSAWIRDCAAKSRILGRFNCISMPHPADCDTFDIMDRSGCRKKLGIPDDRKIILFGSEGADSDPRKGFDKLQAALRLLKSDEYLCIVFGNEAGMSSDEGPEVMPLGYIRDDEKLKLAYNAADVFVSPSVYEALGLTAVEALCCGTPVAAFAIGGLKDTVIHGTNGYLARPFDVSDLAAGIEKLAASDMRSICRESILTRYSYEIVGGFYKELYERKMGQTD